MSSSGGWSSLPRPILVTYVLSILYNITFFMQFVTLPHIVKSLGITDSQNGFLQTIFGIIQVIGGPIFGYINQKCGIRPSLYLCYSSVLVSGVWLYFSQDFYSILFSRVTVLFMHGQQGHQTLLSALTEPGEQRTKAFGRMGLTFGLGFMFTPLLCMASTKLISERAPFLVSAVLAILPCLVLELCIDRKDYETPSTSEEKQPSTSTLNFKNALAILRCPGVLNVLFKKNAPIIPALIIFSAMHLHMVNVFAMTSDASHIIQLVTGVYILLSNGFGVIWLRSRFDEQKLLTIGMTAFIGGYILFFFWYQLWFIFFIMPFISLGMSVVATVGDSLLTSLVEEHEQGLVLGVATSLNSLVRTVGPAVGGVLLDLYGWSALPAVGVVGTSLGLLASSMLPLSPELLRQKKKAE